MLTLLVFIVPIVPLAVALVLTRLILTLVGTGTTRPLTPEARRASRSSGIALAVAALLAVAAATYLIATDRFGRGILLAGPAAMLVIQLGLAAATMIISTAVRRDTDSRIAALSPRTVTTTAPRSLTIATVIGVAIALALTGIASAVASLDEYSGEYRSFTYSTGPDSSRTFGAFPGSYYSVPLAIVLVLSTLVAAATVVGVQRWGALNQPEMDLTLRLGISTRTIAATAMSAGTTLTLYGIALFNAAAKMASSPDDSALWMIGRFAYPAVVIFGLALGAWSFIAFLFPSLGRRVRR